MANIYDVVAFILSQSCAMTAMKLQKIVYYCQAWSLVWDGSPLFSEKIEAWANGPVVKELYDLFRGQFNIENISIGDKDKLTEGQKETVLSVLKHYGSKSAQWLSDLTHMEDPWRKAREGIPEGERSTAEITLASMEEYYSSLPAKS